MSQKIQGSVQRWSGASTRYTAENFIKASCSRHFLTCPSLLKSHNPTLFEIIKWNTYNKDARHLTFMDMSKDVVLWPDSLLNSREQLHAAGSHTCTTQISVTDGRSVSHQDVCVVRYCFPLTKTRFSSGQVECPLAKLWLPTLKHNTW